MENHSNNILHYLYSTATVNIILMAVSAALIKRKKDKKCRPRIWSRSWLQRRSEGKGILHMLNGELLTEDPASYRNFLRMSSEQFEYLLQQISVHISKKDTVMRQCIPARSKLEVTLRYLAGGETFRSLMYSTRIHETTISRFVPDVCKAIVSCLKPIFLKTPSSAEEWIDIATDFNNIWQFPHCLGALDGRHITFRAPISDGSYYHNYKGSNSIVLLGLADANYRFTYINIGVNGRISDGGVFHQSHLFKCMANNLLNFPPVEILPDQQYHLPYVIIADDAFPLMNNLMKPYPERELSHESRIFNYRLSRARRVIENTFGILVNRFRVLLNPINLSVEKVELITLTCVVLHNFLTNGNGCKYVDIETENLEDLHHIGRQCGNRCSNEAKEIRDCFRGFFNSSGSVSWQEKCIQHYNW